MKKFLMLFLVMSVLSSCDEKKVDKSQVILESEEQVVERLEKVDTTVVYWQTNFDTIRKSQNVRIGNDIHQLEFKTYSLNDSSIVKISGSSKTRIYKDVYHDNLAEITLKDGNTIILTSKVRKSTFKDSLTGDFLKYSVLRNVEFDFIRSNRIYFTAQMDVPDTDWTMGADFAIFYRTEKKGQIDFWNVREVGL